MGVARRALTLAALAAAGLRAGAERLAKDITCPVGDRRCVDGAIYLQQAQVLQKAAAQSLERAGSEEGRRANASEAECCRPFSEWPNVDGGVTCEGCKALVLTEPYGGRCDAYCQSFGHVCVRAAEELDESCAVLEEGACDRPIAGTSDMLCTCRLPSARPSCAEARAPSRPPGGGGPSGGRIEVRGRQLLVDGKPLHLKGICWNPVAKAHRRTDFRQYVQQDAELMAKAGINAVRTYSAITDRFVLDTLWEKGIFVVNSVYNSGGEESSRVAAKVQAVKDHPAILMYSVGNEWNYNGLYKDWGLAQSMARVREVAQIIKSIDNAHPVATIYGAAPPSHVIDGLPEVDVWGMNVYSGLSFGDSIDTFAQRSGKPLFMAEYGADAFNANRGAEDDEAQAHATRVLSEEVARRSSVHGRELLGGFLFEFSDEWWKDGHGSKSIHDIGGVAPGGGPYPDKTFNEEWWGIVDVDRNPRQAYEAYANVAIPTSALTS